MDMTDQPRKQLMDTRAWELIQRSSGCENAAEVQGLAMEKRGAAQSIEGRRIDPAGVRADGDQSRCDM